MTSDHEPVKAVRGGSAEMATELPAVTTGGVVLSYNITRQKRHLKFSNRDFRNSGVLIESNCFIHVAVFT